MDNILVKPITRYWILTSNYCWSDQSSGESWTSLHFIFWRDWVTESNLWADVSVRLKVWGVKGRPVAAPPGHLLGISWAPPAPLLGTHGVTRTTCPTSVWYRGVTEWVLSAGHCRQIIYTSILDPHLSKLLSSQLLFRWLWFANFNLHSRQETLPLYYVQRSQTLSQKNEKKINISSIFS